MEGDTEERGSLEPDTATAEIEEEEPDTAIAEMEENEPDTATTEKRRSKRKNYCPYCKRLISNYSRHLVSQHANEEDVQAYIALADKSPKSRKRLRAAVTDRIRHRGNRMFNADIVQGYRGDPFIPARRPAKEGSVVNNVTYVACKHCLGFYKKTLLFKHLARCTVYNTAGGGAEPHVEVEDTTSRSKTTGHVLLQHADQLVNVNVNASEQLRQQVFAKMQKDAFTIAAQSDNLICKYGSEFRHTHRGHKQNGYCSNRMRLLARVFLEMKNARPECITEFSDCISPRHFDLMVATVRNVCKYDEESGTIKTPSVTPRLCSSLKRCANILKSDAMKSETLTNEEITDAVYHLNNFLHLMEKDWAGQVGAISENSRRRQKVVKKDLLPDPDDIRTFSQHINHLCPTYVSALEAVPTVKNYERLAKLIIAHIITLNRRRPNETVEITIEEYRTTLNQRIDYGELENSCDVITAEEMESSKDLVIFYVAANKNLKKVPVLLTITFHRALQVLLASHEKVGVRSKYIFGRPGGTELFDGTSVLREVASGANLKSPSLFTANALRHHAATSSQLQSRDDTYTKRLSKFMGHDLRTHEHFYEMPLPLVQKTKVGHRLLQMTMPKKGTSATATCTSSTLDAEVAPLLPDESYSGPSSLSPVSNVIRLSRSPSRSPSTVVDNTPFLEDTTDLPNSSECVAQKATGGSVWKRRQLRSTGSSEEVRSDIQVETVPDDPLPSTSTSEERPQCSTSGHSLSRATTSANVQSRTEDCEITPTRSTRTRAGVDIDQTETSPGTNSTASSTNTPPKKVFPKRRWTAAEKRIVYETFGQQFVMGMAPTRTEIKTMWERETALKGRSLDQTVTYVNNIVKGKHHIPTPTRKKIKRMVGKNKRQFTQNR